MDKTPRIGLAGLALGCSFLAGIQGSQAVWDDAYATMGQENPVSIPGVNAHVYLDAIGGGLDVTHVDSGKTFGVHAQLDCESGGDRWGTNKGATSTNDDINLQCDFGIPGLEAFGVVWD